MGNEIKNIDQPKIYQAYYEFFFGSNSGYGTVRIRYTNVFDNEKLCKENLYKITEQMSIKNKYMVVYTLNSENKPEVYLLE